MCMMIHWEGEQDEIWAKDWDISRFLRRFPNMASVVEPMRFLLPSGRAYYLVDMIVKEHLPGEKSDYERDKKHYFLSMLSGSRLPDEFFAGKDPRLAIYHAIDHGRIGNEAEVFAVRGNMSQVLDYARVVGGRVSDEVEKFFILDSHEDDKESLKQYVEEFRKK